MRHLLLCALAQTVLFALASAASAGVPPGVPTAGLMGYWPFDGDAADDSGNENGGVIFGASLTQDLLGDPDRAYHFDGIGDNIEIPAAAVLKPLLPATIAAWINLEDFSSIAAVFSNDNASGIYSGVWMQVNTDGQVSAHIGDGGSPNLTNRRSATGRTDLQQGVWYHVAAVIRGPRDMDIYVNGRNEGRSYSGSGDALAYTDAPAKVGTRDDIDPPRLFTGKIDEVYFYDRALSAAEIRELYGDLAGILAACSDNVDNDLDDTVDFPDDPGCKDAAWNFEEPACQDGRDNDGDGRIDFDGGQSIHGICLAGSCPPGVSDRNNDGIADADLQCASWPWRRYESLAQLCGLGFELALLLPPLMWLSGRRRRPRTVF